MSKNTYVITGTVRLSFPHLFAPYAFMQGAKEKYSTVILIDKKDEATINAINAAIDVAIEEGITKKFNGRKPAKTTLHLPLQDGDLEKAELDEAYLMAARSIRSRLPQVKSSQWKWWKLSRILKSRSVPTTQPSKAFV